MPEHGRDTSRVALEPSSAGLTQIGYDPDEAAFFESLFALSNGTLGVRPTVDPEAAESIPGLLHAAAYAPGATVPLEIVVLPSGQGLTIGRADRDPPDPNDGSLKNFERRLDYRRARLDTVYSLDLGNGLAVSVERSDIVHAAHPDLILTWGRLRATGGAGRLRIESTVDARRGNAYGGGHTPSTRLHHARTLRSSITPRDGVTLDLAIRGRETRVALASVLAVEPSATVDDGGGPVRRFGLTGQRIDIDMAEGATIAFRRVVRVRVAEGGTPDLPGDGDVVRAAGRFEDLVAVHEDAWSDRWRRSDLSVEGDPVADARLQFGRFHLVQAMPAASQEANLAARGLTSEYHSGHFFFNTELFKLPFFLLTEPDRAMALMRHRAARLDVARAHARDDGAAGARFPEESDIDGRPAAPWRIDDIYAGTHVVEWSGPQTKFNSALVGLAAHWTATATGDTEFRTAMGRDLVEETARYGLSLLSPNPDGSRSIRGVMCADEYHYSVDDDAFTNEIIRHNLRTAAALGGDDAPAFAAGAAALRAPRRFADGVLEQFDGYALLPDRVITARDANGRPVMEPDVRERADALACFDDRLIKEGDVVLIHDVLPDAYDRDQQRRDLAFYLPRTTMESSLSATPYAVVAARLGQAEEARALMMLSAGFNLDYWPRTNYRNGVHLAAFGGAWRVLCQGFLGQRYSDACLDLEPAPLPPTFGAIRMRLTWRGSPAELRYDGDRLVIAVAPDAAAPLRVRLRLASGVVVTPIAPGAATTVEVR